MGAEDYNWAHGTNSGNVAPSLRLNPNNPSSNCIFKWTRTCGPVLELAQVTPTASGTRSNVLAVWLTGRLTAFLCLRAGFWTQTYKNDKQVGFMTTNIQLSFTSNQVDQVLLIFLAHNNSVVAQLFRWMMGHATEDISLGANLKTTGPEISCS